MDVRLRWAMKNRFFLITLAILSIGLFVTSNVRAEDAPQPDVQPQAQPPAQTTVGRISVIHGDVSTMRGDAGQWAPGTVNTPVVPGDKVATADRSRAEVQLDFANVMRLDQHTEAKVADLEQNKIQIQLASGLIDYSVSNGTQADAEIDTPNMGVHPLAPGIYRIQVNSPSETLLIVRQGEAEVLTNEGSTKVEAGQVIQIHGTDNTEYKIDSAPGGDDFDKWCSDRDRQIKTAQAWQHTDPQYTGSSDLDANGQWSEVPDYGWCWTPQVDAGWVPYSAGYWGYEPYWGYTWISAEPWGWAPYHYGRWFMYGGAWRWWPARGFGGGIWSPAYVSFFGFGGRGLGLGVGFGFGSIGWLALGPRDIFHPWFGAGRSFGAMGLNDIHGAGFIRPGGPRFGSNLETIATDSHVRGALRSVSSQDFASGRMSRSMPASESTMRSGSMMRGTLPVAHTQGSLGNRAGNFSSNRSATANGEHFFSRGGATAEGRAGGNAEGFGARSNSIATGRTETSQPRAGGSSYNWQRYSTSGRSPATASGPSTGFQGRSSTAPQGNQHNWQRFASPSPYSGRTGSGQSTQRGGWQGYNSQSRSYSGGGSAGRSGGWNAPAPRSGGSYYGGGSRPPLNLNRPIMRQRAPNSGYYGGGGRTYSAPSGGNHNSSAPKSGGGHSYSAPKSSGGGGGGHSSGGGGGHSSGGGHGGGRR